LGRGEKFAFGAGRQGEFVEPKNGIAGAAAKIDDGSAVGGKFGGDGSSEGVVAGLGEVAEVGERIGGRGRESDKTERL
jgi:hypothetical protein